MEREGNRVDLEKPVRMVMTGKFQAPRGDWIHMSRELNDFELIVMAEGELHIACDGEEYNLEPGDFLLLPPRSRQRGTGPSECSFYWLHFIPREGEGGATLFLPRRGTLFNGEKVILLLGHLQDSVRRYDHPVLNDSLATAVVGEIHCQTSGEQGRIYRRIFYDMLDYIRRHGKISLRVRDMADHFGYNPHYLSHLFAREYGTPLKQVIRSMVMDEAKVLLTDSPMNISQIAYALGYEDSHHFMKSFKRSTGLTPTEYREASPQRLLYHQ